MHAILLAIDECIDYRINVAWYIFCANTHSDFAIENNRTHKWWYGYWVLNIDIPFIALIISAVNLSLVLKLNIPAPRHPETTIALSP